MAYNGNAVNEEQIASFLAEALRSLDNASDSEIDALNATYKLFKKNVHCVRLATTSRTCHKHMFC